MSAYKLHYFNLRGRAESIRLILTAAGVAFDDVRYERADWTPELKNRFPFGQLPVLEVDGHMLAESRAIARLLAKRHGLAGADDIASAKADAYVDLISEISAGVRAIVWEADEERKKQLIDQHVTSMKAALGRIEDHLARNGTGFLVGDQLTWADLSLFNFYEFNCQLLQGAGYQVSDVFGRHVTALASSIARIPAIASYISRRPVTRH